MKNKIIMVKCPNCGKELTKSKKSWTYGVFKVQAYLCDCGTSFREYMRAGKHSFTLKAKKGKRLVKV